MNRYSKILSLITLIMAVGVATLLAQTSSNSAKEIAAVPKQWETNWNAHNPEALVQLYAHDAVFLTFSGERIVGREAIRKYLKALLDSIIGLGSVTINSIDMEESGSLAFVSGSFSDKQENSGSSGNAGKSAQEQRKPEGYYLIVLKRQANGGWLIQQQCSTVLPPQE